VVIEELRPWRGNAISLAGKHLQDVLVDLHRDVIDVRAEASFRRQPSNGMRRWDTRTFRVVGIWNDGENRYHLHITNLSKETFAAAEITELHRLRWEVELLFRELKSSFALEGIWVSEPVIIEPLLVVAVPSLVVSRTILDQLRELEATAARTTGDEPAEIPSERASKVVRRHADTIHCQLMLKRGYDWSGLDAVLH